MGSAAKKPSGFFHEDAPTFEWCASDKKKACPKGLKDSDKGNEFKREELDARKDDTPKLVIKIPSSLLS